MDARGEAQRVVDEGMGFAERLLAKDGGFDPFAVVMEADGALSVQKAQGAGGSGHRAMVALESLMRRGARSQRWRAVAVFVDTRVRPRGGKETVPAVLAEVEHRSGYAADLYIPYRKGARVVTADAIPSARVRTMMV